jgi:hypothetical protein
MELRNALSYVNNVWGALSASSLMFPLANDLLDVLYVPVTNEQEGVSIALINSLFCAFALLLSFSAQRLRRSLYPAVGLFALGIVAYIGYGYLVSPLIALNSLGIRADITYLSGIPILVYQGLYWLIFASLTGAFTSLAGFSYQLQRSFISWG